MPDQAKPSNEQLNEILDLAKRTALKDGAAVYEAEEVSQETAIKLITQWDSEKLVKARARGCDQWRNYVVTVARNTLRDLIRSHKRRIARERRSVGVAGVPLDERPAVHRVQPRDPSGVEQYLARQTVKDLIESLSSHRQRECMGMVYLDGRTIRETAKALDLDSQTVRFHLRRARVILREQLDGARSRA